MESARILDIIKQWIVLLRDVAVQKTVGTAAASAGGVADPALIKLGSGWETDRLIAAIQLAETIRRQLQRNANARLMLESLLIRSADLYWGGKENADHRRSPV
jgi:DNA polymerase III gamma/tau subunit